MDKNYQIINRNQKPLLTFRASEQQARLIWSAVYDTEFTDLREMELDHANDFKFEIIGEKAVKVTKHDMHLFEFYQNEKGEFIQTTDEGEEIGKLDVEVLKQFPAFLELYECPHCEGSGLKEGERFCTQPASNCCGGCFTEVACECETVIFD